MNNKLIPKEMSVIHREVLPNNKLQFISFDETFLQIERELRKARSEISWARNQLHQLKYDYKKGWIKPEYFQIQSQQYTKLLDRYSKINRVYIDKFKSKVEYTNSLNFFISKFNSELWQERQNQAKWFPKKHSFKVKARKQKRSKININNYSKSIQKNIKKIIEIRKRLRFRKLHYDDANQYIQEDINTFINLAERLGIPYNKFIVINRFEEYEQLVYQLFSKKIVLLKVDISDKLISLIHHFMFNQKEELSKMEYDLLGVYEQFFKWLFNDVNYNDKRSYDQKMDDYVEYLLETTPIDYKFK